MKSKKRKFFSACFIIAALFIVGFLGSVYIWGMHTAERELSKYAAEVLNLNEKITCRYDWHNDRYLADNDLGFTLDYRRKNNTIHDESFSQKEEERATGDYHALTGKMADNLTFPTNIMVWTEISADDYNTKTQRLYLLGIYNDEDISKEDSLSMPADIVMEVIDKLGESYNFTGVQAIYFDKNGMFEITIPIDVFEKITENNLLSNTKERSKEEYPEDYIHWLEEKEGKSL